MFRYQYQFFGTIRPKGNFDAEIAATALYEAMRGFGCDKESVLSVLTEIDNQQRQQVVQEFKSLYGEDLEHKLKSELHGDFEHLIIALLKSSTDYDVRQLHHAIRGLGTKEKILVEILCSRTNEQLGQMKDTYQEKYGQTLEDAVEGDTSGDFEKLLVSLLQANRDDGNHVDQARARHDAERLAEDGERRIGTVESTFNSILVSQNFSQLKCVFKNYEEITGHTIQHAVKSEFHGDIKKGLLTLVQNIIDQPGHFAHELHKAMKGWGTHDKDLIRIIVSRSEIDLALIRDRYEENYGNSLSGAINDECSGTYCKALIAIVSGN